MVVLKTITLDIHVHESSTITSDATTLHVCKQQQIASGNKLLFSDTFVSNWLIVVLMSSGVDDKIYLIHLHSPLPLMLYTRLHVCKQQQIASGNRLLLVIQ